MDSNPTSDDDPTPKLQKLSDAFNYFIGLFQNGQFGEAVIRILIYLALVWTTHFLLIWIFWHVIIPTAQKWFYDQLLHELKTQLWNVEWKGISLGRISKEL